MSDSDLSKLNFPPFLYLKEKDKFIFPEDCDLSQVAYFKNMTNSTNESETPTAGNAIASTNQKQDAVTNVTKETEITEIKQKANSDVNNQESTISNSIEPNNVPQVFVNYDASLVDH